MHFGGTAQQNLSEGSWYGCCSVMTTSTGNLFQTHGHKIRIQLDSISIENAYCNANANDEIIFYYFVACIRIVVSQILSIICYTYSSIRLHTFGPVNVVSSYSSLETPLYLDNGNPNNITNAMVFRAICILIDDCVFYVRGEGNQRNFFRRKLYDEIEMKSIPKKMH